jgi:peptidoglycan/LPS O-acetylase OafA/YrhL
MHIRIGHEPACAGPQATSTNPTSETHPSLVTEVIVPDHVRIEPFAPVFDEVDGSGHWRSRFIAPGTALRIGSADGAAGATRAAVGPRAKADRGHVPALDGIRGVAILVVVLYHLTLWGHVIAPIESLWLWTSMGHVGVDLFFVLSGYLITGILYDSRGSSTYLGTFFARRTLRIFPLYFAAVFLFAVLAPHAAPHNPKLHEIAANQIWLWTYTSNIAVAVKNTWVFSGVNHFWSLAVEEQFYLVWPFIVLKLERRTLVRLCFAMAGLAMVFRWLLIAVIPGHDLGTYSLTICRMDALLLGAALALEIRGTPGRAPTGPWATWSRRLAIPAIAAAIFVSFRGVPAEVGTSGTTPITDVFTPTLWSIGFAGLVSASLIGRTPVARTMRNSVLRFFGRYSYGLYVFHYPMHPIFEKLVPIRSFHSVWLGTAVFVAVGLALSTAVALASFHLFENRFLALKSRFRTQKGQLEPARSPKVFAPSPGPRFEPNAAPAE